MKSLINPPIQWVLWMAGGACLSITAWQVLSLRGVEPSLQLPNYQVPSIADTATYQPSSLTSYQALVNQPLFWETRSPPVPESPPVVALEAVPVVPVVVDVPQGRLVGVVSIGKKSYAVVRSETEQLSLYQGDQWEGWTVSRIERDRIQLTAGQQEHELKLLADFSAPSQNKQMLAQPAVQNVARPQQAAQQVTSGMSEEAIERTLDSLPAELAANILIPMLQPMDEATNGRQPETTADLEEKKVLSVQDALIARQRLMAARWGNATRSVPAN